MAAKTSERVERVPLQVKCYSCSLTNQSELASEEPVGIPTPPHLHLHLLAAVVANPHVKLLGPESVSACSVEAGLAPQTLLPKLTANIDIQLIITR